MFEFNCSVGTSLYTYLPLPIVQLKSMYGVVDLLEPSFFLSNYERT